MTPLPAATGWLAGMLIHSVATASFGDTYYQLHYDYEAAAQCGLVSGAVEQAFRRKRRRLDDAATLAPADLKAIRIRAYVAVEREYNNRGLGGHKQWCRGDVSDGVARILRP